MQTKMINKVGRRKAAVARVYLTEGNGNLTVNGRQLEEYFPVVSIRMKVEEPMLTLGIGKEFDIKVVVNGGGYKGQAEAIRMAISRAFVEVKEDYKKPLKEKKMLTRDAREVERKKFGKPKARKSFQFSKR
ncbi:MAG: 30S ribosomal protein S9 [Saprospiraceae bacterium]|jgi:small subunit ribosomal protein S9|nr:30S ribosomal protein S9 [Saprospiraceae bacterium]MBK7221467.1 30S ribosomal protein S9 [Saprospiraceae bacterium]MBK7788433.1 30S ribosomal protein S9 [Saprospiraceae bacterium]MBK8110919.1 30S ribosomal protein S9 [Saprospiraceae bacterium]MBK8851650.1 30S ribosomal protein S9 [Saprospiraceae bacterium]